MNETASITLPAAVEGVKEVHVLIVDDEPSNLKLLTKVLLRDGYKVQTAANGEEALRRTHDSRVDLLLLDITMPIMDGLSVCRELRKHFRTRGIPILMLTARGSVQDRILGYRAGADDYIVKPFDLEELKARMEGALERRRWDLYRHPMTGLPGSLGIEEEVQRRIPSLLSWSFAYIDIDYFKAYNDVYGYESGDRVIQHVASLLIECTHLPGGEAVFPGHIGGDDFVLIGPVEFLRTVLPEILSRFDQARPTFYSSEDLARGSIVTKDRLGREQEFPFVALTAAIVSSETRRITRYARLIEIASELKSFVKRQDHGGKSMLMWDRRRDPDVP